MANILLVEDDKKTADFIRSGLTAEGFSVHHAVDGRTGLDLGLEDTFDAAIVDIMLPGLDGLSLVEQLRSAGSSMPILFLSGRKTVEDRLSGFKAGGDDYLTSYRDMAVTVIEESDRLVGQINTILELAEIDAGLKVMTMGQVDLARIVNMAVELYQPAAEERDISLTVQIKKQPFFVTGNVNSLQRLLANLLDNAVKFTPAGGKIITWE